MQYRRFGRTNLLISLLTFGAMRIPFGDRSPEERARAEENAFLAMKRALEVGVNHFETARGYGNSEHLIGMWLPHLPVRREQLIITTKIPPTQSADEMRRYIDESCSATVGTGSRACRQMPAPTAGIACRVARSS
ncbi:MAG: hypothetical protein C4335_05830 [Armatimonadota bacterium]